MNFMKYIFLALCIAAASAVAAPDCAGIDAGTKAYNGGDFERAIDEWRTCADNGTPDADLLYNLGNAYFRSGKIGFAIFYYRSALRLRPGDDDIQHNLKFAQAMTRDKVDEDEEENPILSGLFKAHHALSLKAQLFTLLAIFWIIASSAAYKIFVLEKEICGVVTAADADVTSAPSDKSQTLNTLSEGTTFEVISEQGNYAEIRLGEKIKGFVKLSEVGIIK